MRYFRLATDCFLVEGENDSVIYDVHGGRVFLLDAEAQKLLRRCEDNEPLDDRLAEGDRRVLDALQAEGAGFYDLEPAHVDKLLLHQPIEWMGMAMVAPTFLRADWAITNQCDLDCAFCGRGRQVVFWQGCQTCLRRDKVLHEHWLPENPHDFVAEIAGLGTRTLHIRGGNPLLEWNYLQTIARAVRDTSLQLVVTTPGTGRTVEEIVDLCEQERIQINIIMFGIHDEDSNVVGGYPGLVSHQRSLIDALVGRHLPAFLTVLLSDSTRQHRQEILRWALDRWNTQPSFAEICFRDALHDGFRLTHVTEKARPLSSWRSAEEFFFRVQHNSCIYGNFEVCCDGKLRSCAGLDKVLGDVAEAGLRNALAGDPLYDLWDLDKGRVEPCKHCALRYACLDCTAFELEGEQDPNFKQAYCPHDPFRCAPGHLSEDWARQDPTGRLSGSASSQA